MTFYARTRLDDKALLQAIPRLVARLDPNLPVEDLRSMDQQIRQNIGVDRVITILSAAFAVVATLLAAIGLYGVLAYTVAQRTREIGLRMALGADAGRVRRLILGRVGWMTLVGASVGLLAAIALGMAAGSQLYDLKGYDPMVLVDVDRAAGDGRVHGRAHPGDARLACQPDDRAAKRLTLALLAAGRLTPGRRTDLRTMRPAGSPSAACPRPRRDAAGRRSA